MSARVRMGPLEEKLEIELPPEKENEEDLFIFKTEKITERGVTFQKCKRERQVFILIFKRLRFKQSIKI